MLNVAQSNKTSQIGNLPLLKPKKNPASLLLYSNSYKVTINSRVFSNTKWEITEIWSFCKNHLIWAYLGKQVSDKTQI